MKVPVQRILLVFTFLAAAAVTPARLMAGPILYTFTFSYSSPATLESFNGTGPSVPVAIGSLGVEAPYGGLAYDTNNNTMYLVDGDGANGTAATSNLYRVNLSTGAATLIGSTGLFEVTGLTYDSANNTLYGAQYGGGNPLDILNINTGAATAVSAADLGYRVDNLAYDSTSGVLYGWADCELNCATLHSIDTSTGVDTLLSGSGLNSNDSGIVYDPVTNLLWDLDVNISLTTINLSTYVQSSVGSPGSSEQSGLALIPASTSSVPEPSTIALIGSSMAVLLARWRRRVR